MNANMEFMLAAEQYAQAAAVVQLYANAAINAAQNSVIASQAGQPPPPPPPPGTFTSQLLPGTPILGSPFLPQPPLPQEQPVIQRDKRRDDEDRDDDRDRRNRRERHRESRRDHRERSRSRSRSRDRERSRSRSRSRDRDRRDRERRRERDRSPRRDRDRRDRTPESDDDATDESPNNTIMLRGLGQYISSGDIQNDIQSCGLVARDIRLIRKKDTGASRGFGFVEFAKIEDAQKWMDERKGYLELYDQSRATMHYSLPRDGRSGELPKLLQDWVCPKCCVQNFKRRDYCFKCSSPRVDSSQGEDVGPQPTVTVLLKNLDALSTEDSVLNCLKGLTNLSIKSIRIGRDRLTNMSKGVCYVEMNTVSDAVFLHNQLLAEPPMIDDKLISVNYYRPPVGGSGSGSSSGRSSASSSKKKTSSAANVALAAAQWSHQGKSGSASAYSAEEIERMADYSASLYAKTPSEKVQYYEYYKDYYTNGGDPNAGKSAGAITAEPEAKKKAEPSVVTINGVEYPRYPSPDVTTYSYDESSGFYYDSSTTLYYDSNSQYYFNSKTNQYVYWNPEYHTYLPAPTDDKGSGAKKADDKKDKVKTAKRIAKDMEKWAKTLNQKKTSASTNVTAAPTPSQNAMAVNIGRSVNNTEDIAFSMLHNNRAAATTSSAGDNSLANLAGYGSDGSDDDGSGEAKQRSVDESSLTDWTKLACLLCKRQFPSKDKLSKHNQISDLHKQNLENWRRENGIMACDGEGVRYRDRAEERRKKYGVDNAAPKKNGLKEKYLRARDEADTYKSSMPGETRKVGGENIGNQMLQKMGWKEGLGLGRTNQGRTSIVEADGRTTQAGLGSSSSVKVNPNESYKDNAKRTLYSRYDCN